MDLFSPSDTGHVHFMGVAGAGMSALALVARHRGVAVSGCDIDTSGAGDLTEIGVQVVEGHGPSHLEGARALVVSAAIPAASPEIEYAEATGIPVIPRKKALAELVAGGRVVGIAGTHGKTTTTVMVCEVLRSAGLSPTGIAGGRVAGWGGNATLGTGDLYVVEADEYDRAFLELSPWLSVVTNVEAEHLDTYGSVAGMEAAFTSFLNRADRVVVSAEDVGAKRVSAGLLNHIVSFGIECGDISASDVEQTQTGTRGLVSLPEGQELRLELQVPGLHNVRNALAALGVAHQLGIDPEVAGEALRGFTGVGRRFERLGEAKGIGFVDDYAHHPSEVVAVLEAARQAFPGRRLVVVFQPHLYSRTQRESEALGTALAGADLVVVTDVYAAREDPIDGVTGERVAVAARAAGVDTVYEPDRALLEQKVYETLRPGDAVLTLGAGDVTRVGRELVQWLRDPA